MSAPANRVMSLKAGQIDPMCLAIVRISTMAAVKLRHFKITAPLLDAVVS